MPTTRTADPDRDRMFCLFWLVVNAGAWLLVGALLFAGCATVPEPPIAYSADDATRALEQARVRQWQDEERARVWRDVRPYTVRP